MSLKVTLNSIISRGSEMPKGKKEKAMDHKQHMKLQRDKELKRNERRGVELPAEYNKSKK
jgi:hypothetical protein